VFAECTNVYIFYNTDFFNLCNGIRQTAVGIGVRSLQNTTAELIYLPSPFQTWFENLKTQPLSTCMYISTGLFETDRVERTVN
jgi:hypothetical protein